MFLLEGNISSGKTTLGRALAEENRIGFIEEPVSTWQTGFDENLLDLFYKDSKRWAFTFQMAAFMTRVKTWDEVLALTDHSNIVLERSIYADRYIFAKNCYQKGLISRTEYNLYGMLWDWLEEKWCDSPDKIIYLRTPAKVCHERLRLRGRGEEESVPLSYLEDLEKLHDDWLLGNPKVVVIDGSDTVDLGEVYEKAGIEGQVREAVTQA